METFLLCKPDFFRVEYSINPWMGDVEVDYALANRQWKNLSETIKSLGAAVKLIDPVEKYPDMVFTANSGFVVDNKVILSRMKHDVRKGETAYFERWFADHDYDIVHLAPGISFEGRGDCLLYDDVLIGGYGYRTDRKAIEIIADVLGIEYFDLKLTDPRFYHLDTCFCKVSRDTAIYYPGAFLKSDIKKLKSHINLIPITEQDARLFMCNSMLVSDILLIPDSHSEISRLLRNHHGIKTCFVDVSEFLKSGGSIQCLSLKI